MWIIPNIIRTVRTICPKSLTPAPKNTPALPASTESVNISNAPGFL